MIISRIGSTAMIEARRVVGAPIGPMRDTAAETNGRVETTQTQNKHKTEE